MTHTRRFSWGLNLTTSSSVRGPQVLKGPLGGPTVSGSWGASWMSQLSCPGAPSASLPSGTEITLTTLLLVESSPFWNKKNATTSNLKDLLKSHTL